MDRWCHDTLSGLSYNGPMPMIAEPSVKSLLLEMRVNGTPLATGTGFVCASAKGAVLLTNRHNVTGVHQETGKALSPTGGLPNEVVIVHNYAGVLGRWLPVVEPLLDANGTPRWREHPTLGAKADFVALPLTNLTNVELRPYTPASPGPEIAVGPGEVVSVVGFPFGITAGGAFAVWATGFMASEPEVDFNQLPIFLIDCRSRPGQSGSAVIAYRAGGAVPMKDGSSAMFGGPVDRFLGIYSGRINSESDLGIVWKASALAELIAAV